MTKSDILRIIDNFEIAVKLESTKLGKKRDIVKLFGLRGLPEILE